MQDTTAKWKIHHTPIVRWKGIQTNQVKAIIILISTWKQNKHTQITQFARQKKTENALGNFMKLSSLPDEST